MCGIIGAPAFYILLLASGWLAVALLCACVWLLLCACWRLRFCALRPISAHRRSGWVGAQRRLYGGSCSYGAMELWSYRAIELQSCRFWTSQLLDKPTLSQANPTNAPGGAMTLWSYKAVEYCKIAKLQNSRFCTSQLSQLSQLSQPKTQISQSDKKSRKYANLKMKKAQIRQFSKKAHT